MIVINIGGEDYNLRKPQRMTFKAGVPTWIPDELIDHLPSVCFEIYDSHKHQAESEEIFVRVGSTLYEVCYGVIAIQEIQKNFPTCSIIVLANFYKQLIPAFCNVIESSKAGLKYYREFDLRKKSNLSYISSVHITKQSVDRLILQAIGFFDPKKDLKDLGMLFDMPDCEENDIVLIDQGEKLGDTNVDLTNSILSSFQKITTIHGSTPENFRMTLGVLKNAKFVICVGTSDLIDVVCRLGKKAFIFTKDGLDVAMKLSRYEGIQYTPLQKSYTDDELKRITNGLSNLIKGKESHESSEPDDKPRPKKYKTKFRNHNKQ